MGQNSSGLAEASPRRKNTVKKPPRPLEPPKIPKPPKHVVPENKVIPNGVNDMEQARKLLRPVSQELTKVHPDFADIFQYDPEIDFLAGGDDSSLERSLNIDPFNKENASLKLSNNSLSAILMTDGQHANGSLPNGNASVPNGSFESKSMDDLTTTHHSASKPVGIRRSQSMQRDNNSHPAKYALHRRQASFSNGLSSVNNSVIVEDPREHLYNITRDQPFSNIMPSSASLPLENSFGLDYSFNLTYAQLAEHRRQRRVSELEERTGKKMSEMSAEISANNVVPKSPFDRQSIGNKSGTLSVSTGSSETGVSKSKKKRAPPPPGGPPPLGRVGSTDSKIGSEPPADYDMQDMPSMDFNRRNSSASRFLKAPAPQPFPKRMSVPSLSQSEMQVSHRMLVSKTQVPSPPNSNDSISAPPAPPPPPPPPPPPAPPAPPVLGQPNSVSSIGIESKPNTVSNNFRLPSTLSGQTSLSESISLARAQIEALKRLEDVLGTPTPKEENTKDDRGIPDAKSSTSEPSISGNNDDETTRFFRNSSHQDKATPNKEEYISTVTISKLDDTISTENKVTGFGERADDKKEILFQNVSVENKAVEKPTATPMVKRMSSLLQHDIVLAAQARGAKVKKIKPPPALEKPLDMSEIFRQELAKAASEREERRRNVLTINGSSGEDGDSRSSSSQSNSRPSSPRTNAMIAQVTNDTQSTEETYTNSNVNILKRQSVQAYNSSEVPVTAQNGFVQDVSKSKTELDADFLVNGFDKHSKQPSIHSEDMSISSGNSQRIFSPSWVPEDDLESDDDIVAGGYVHPNLSARSEGFKSSILPSKIKDLNVGKKEKKRQMKKKESDGPFTEKRKMESVRKLKDSVQSGMKKTFGSISRASGKLLRKNKSQDFLDVRATDYAVPSPRVFRREEDEDEGSNWELASSSDGSIRRSLSDANLKKHELNSNGGDISDSYSDAESDIGDIDFSTGLNASDESKAKLRNKLNGKPFVKSAAGVAYVNGEGGVNSKSGDGSYWDNKNMKDKKIGIAKLFGGKKAGTPTSPMPVGGEDEMTIEIREKERRLNVEKQKQQAMEQNFRRLQDLETQERLQSIRTANMRHQITMLQQQQVRQAHVQLNNNSLGVSTSSLSSTTQIPQSTPLGNSAFLTNASLDFPALASLPQSTSNLGYTQQQQHQHSTDTPRDVFGRGMTVPSLSNTFNASQFTTHSSPMIGGPPIAPAMTNLTNQELSYLSNYMRVMGVQPPSTQQQWALLLSTIRMNAAASSQSQGFGLHQTQGFGLHQTQMHSGVPFKSGGGPDMSRLFGGSGKRLEDTLLNASPRELPGIMNHHTGPMQPYDSSYNNGGNNIYSTSGGFQIRNSPLITDASMDNLQTQQIFSHEKDLNNTSLIHLAQHMVQSDQSPSFDITTATAVGNEQLNDSGSTMNTSTTQSSLEQQGVDSPTSSGIPAKDTTNQEDSMTTPATHQPSTFSSKVYGPIGFRPVSFSSTGTAS